MSSLPPYNPAPSERRLWLLNSATAATEREPLMRRAGAVTRIESEEIDELREAVRSGDGDMLLLAPEAALEALVLGLIGGKHGMARLRILPGTLSQVQILPDRAVVRHLNPGIDV